MNWQERITSNPKIAGGKPIINGTRLSVGFLLSLFSRGWSQEYVLEQYPHLTREDLDAMFAFIQQWFEEDLRLNPMLTVKAA